MVSENSDRRGFVRKIMGTAAASALAGLLLGRSTQPALGATNTFPADGNVGIGTLSPVRQLHIQGNNAVARLDRDTDIASVIFARTAPGNFSEVWKSFTLGVKASGGTTAHSSSATCIQM